MRPVREVQVDPADLHYSGVHCTHMGLFENFMGDVAGGAGGEVNFDDFAADLNIDRRAA